MLDDLRSVLVRDELLFGFDRESRQRRVHRDRGHQERQKQPAEPHRLRHAPRADAEPAAATAHNPRRPASAITCGPARDRRIARGAAATPTPAPATQRPRPAVGSAAVRHPPEQRRQTQMTAIALQMTAACSRISPKARPSRASVEGMQRKVQQIDGRARHDRLQKAAVRPEQRRVERADDEVKRPPRARPRLAASSRARGARPPPSLDQIDHDPHDDRGHERGQQQIERPTIHGLSPSQLRCVANAQDARARRRARRQSPPMPRRRRAGSRARRRRSTRVPAHKQQRRRAKTHEHRRHWCRAASARAPAARSRRRDLGVDQRAAGRATIDENGRRHRLGDAPPTRSVTGASDVDRTKRSAQRRRPDQSARASARRRWSPGGRRAAADNRLDSNQARTERARWSATSDAGSASGLRAVGDAAGPRDRRAGRVVDGDAGAAPDPRATRHRARRTAAAAAAVSRGAARIRSRSAGRARGDRRRDLSALASNALLRLGLDPGDRVVVGRAEPDALEAQAAGRDGQRRRGSPRGRSGRARRIS